MVCDGDYTVRYIDLPLSIPGITFLQDGHYNVYINSALSVAQQEDAMHHELDHLHKDDFDASKSLEEVEPYRCGQAYNITKTKPMDNNVQPVQIGADSEIMIPVFSDVLAAVRWLEKKKTCTAEKPYKPIDKRKLDIYMEIK